MKEKGGGNNEQQLERRIDILRVLRYQSAVKLSTHKPFSLSLKTRAARKIQQLAQTISSGGENRLLL